jgi:hypothetical protein
MRRYTSRLAITVALLLGFSGTSVPLVAQQIPEQKLTRADATYPIEFSSIRGLLELPDGKVLLSDGIDETLLRFSMAGGKIDTIGRAGQGPGEYKGPDLLFSISNGGVVLLDLGNGRLTMFDRDLKYRDSKSIARGSPREGLMMIIPRATDARGGIYFEHAAFGPGGGGRPDSSQIIRYDPTTEAFDTVAAVKRENVKVSTSGSAQNRSVSMRSIPFSPRDAWAVAQDGRIAIARAAEYRLEWVTPARAPRVGPANTWRPVPIKQAEKLEWVGQSSDGVSIAVSNNNGQMSVTMRRGGMRMGGSAPPDTENQDWPEAKPPFVTNGVWVSPASEAWVERSVPAGSGRVFDIFGANGTLTRRVVLPEGRRLMGFGKGVIYTRRSTEDDLQILERFRLP